MSQSVQVHLLLDPQLLEQVEEYRWRMREPSRKSALARLIEAGLAAKGMLHPATEKLELTRAG